MSVYIADNKKTVESAAKSFIRDVALQRWTKAQQIAKFISLQFIDNDKETQR